MLSFTCRPGYELHGEATIRCLPGHPSEWSGAPPACRGRNCHAEKKSDNIHEGCVLIVMRENKDGGGGGVGGDVWGAACLQGECV